MKNLARKGGRGFDSWLLSTLFFAASGIGVAIKEDSKVGLEEGTMSKHLWACIKIELNRYKIELSGKDELWKLVQDICNSLDSKKAIEFIHSKSD
ncbi:hypothetical protein BB560_004919, partial [Smittium megazygosporum]